jgi:hypothetical protein
MYVNSTLTRNIRERRGEKVNIRIPLYQDSKTAGCTKYTHSLVIHHTHIGIDIDLHLLFCYNSVYTHIVSEGKEEKTVRTPVVEQVLSMT